MAPIRRYLRITRYSVLEVRIYLDNPAHTDNWLLRRNDPALPRVIEAVRPLVLPKLREENERAKGKGKGKKGVKDVISGDDFEVSIFLTDLSTRHTLLTKHKTFDAKPRIQSTSNKLTGWLNNSGSKDAPLDLSGADAPVLRTEDTDEPVNLDDIPDANPAADTDTRTSKPRRKRPAQSKDADEDTLFVADDASDSSAGFEEVSAPRKKRTKKAESANTEEDEAAAADDKKKLGLATQYDGFSIYGRILCLVVKRKGSGAKTGAGAGASGAQSSQQMLENWVSTQAAKAVDDEDEDG